MEQNVGSPVCVALMRRDTDLYVLLSAHCVFHRVTALLMQNRNACTVLKLIIKENFPFEKSLYFTSISYEY